MGSVPVFIICAEEDWGDGLRVLTTFMPESCDHRAKKDDIVHYHYVGRLEENGNIFGRRLVVT